jgi:hypothetical protein
MNLALQTVLAQFTPDSALTRAEYAHDAYSKLLYAKKSQDFLFLAMGKILKDIRDEKLYIDLDFDNFGQFLASEELSFSRESAFLYIRVFEFYIEYLQLNEEHIQNISVSKLAMLVPVLKKMASKEEAIEFIQDTENLRYGEFVREVKQKQGSTKPNVYWSEEHDKWIVAYHEQHTILQSL